MIQLRLPSSTVRAAAAAVLATTALTTALPAVAHAEPGDRSVTVTLENYSGDSFYLDSSHVYEGEWNASPITEIETSGSDYFGSVSTDDEGGTSGYVTFTDPQGDEIRVYWDNPWSGTNEFTCSVPDHLTCSWEDDTSASASVTFTVS